MVNFCTVGLMGMLLGMVVTAMLSNDTGNVGKVGHSV